ncbi:MAG: diguanylate cyclase [Gemmatimonadota bacterium]|nr:MAG: diguanylate cyclase [Gemmatimonadota bacterium]
MSGASIKVLLVEDNPGDTRLIEEILTEAKGTVFDLECTDRIPRARECLTGEDFDLVLLGLLLPDSQGLDTFAKIRTHAPEMPVVVLSGLNDETIAVTAVHQGAQDYLVKGQVDSNEVVRSIRYAIEWKKMEETIRKLAYFDPLTSLPNRVLFNDRLNLALAHAHRNEQKLTVMLIDLDRFKDVNDSLGHSREAPLLKVVGVQLTHLLRQEDTIARMGGNECLLLLPEISGIEDVDRVAHRILEIFQKSFAIDGHELTITACIGIAVYPEQGPDADRLMKHADIAMYQAKDTGRNGYQMYM